MPVFDRSGGISPQNWLIRGKIAPPPPQVQLIARRALLVAADQFLTRRLGLVIAPAGFGKTTLLSQWRQKLIGEGHMVAWLTLDADDAAPQSFLSGLILALESAGLPRPGPGGPAGAPQPEMAPRDGLARLLDRIAAIPTKVVIILDGYQCLQSPDIDALMRDMMAAGVTNLCIVIDSRNCPPLHVPQLLAAGYAREINAEALRFTSEELREVAPELPEPLLDALHAKTEGWPVAVQLALLLARGASSVSQLSEQLTGRSGHLAAYIGDQLFGALPADAQDFLIRTSILDRFNAALANAVCDRPDSWEMLCRLDHLQPLLAADDRQEWFRHHPLLADYLRSLLRRRAISEQMHLHHAASQWFEAEGHIVEAVRHARLAGDFAHCAELVERAGGWELILFGGIGLLRDLLGNFPASEVARFPRLQVAQAYLLIKEGHTQEARALCDAAAANPNRPASREELDRDLLNIRWLLDYCYEDHRVDRTRLAALKACINNLSPYDGVTRGILYCLLALSNLAVGQFAEAEHAAKQSMGAMRQANTTRGLNYCYLHAAVSVINHGQFQTAEAYLWEACRMAKDNFEADSGPMFVADVLSGALSFWRGDLDGDREQIFHSSLHHVELNDGWFEVFAIGLDAGVEMALASDNPERARLAISRAAQVAAERSIHRLHDIATAYALRLTSGRANDSDDRQIIARLNQQYPIGCWRDDPYRWRPYVEFAMSAGARGGDDLVVNHRLDDAIECCRHLGANLHLIRLLVRRALRCDQKGHRSKALVMIVEALQLAAAHRIRRPFRHDRAVMQLLRAAQRKIHEESGNGPLLRFVVDCIEAEQISRRLDWPTVESGTLSARERDVLRELADGLSNKQIAQMLNMTEHTVKFHLKNIFAKLGIKRRTQAISIAQQGNIIAQTYPNVEGSPYVKSATASHIEG